MTLGYQAVMNYQLYIITDYIGVSDTEAGNIVSILSVITLVTTTIANMLAGRASDALGRRKVFVGIATLLIGGFICIPLISPPFPASSSTVPASALATAPTPPSTWR